MTILRPATVQRRDPIGRHECHNCGAVIRIDAADITSIPLTGTKLRDPNGALWWLCPECNTLLLLNGRGVPEPPAP